MARRHNDANVLCMGGRTTGPGVAMQMLDIFLVTEAEGGRHARRVEKIEAKATSTPQGSGTTQPLVARARSVNDEPA